MDDVNQLKGRMAEALVEGIFKRAQYMVARVARETQVSALMRTGQSVPDFVVWKALDEPSLGHRSYLLLAVEVKYVVANPSSYAYPDSARPVMAKGVIDFGPFEGRACSSFDWWPYGLADRRGYTEKESVADLRRQLARRPTTYLLGERDVLPVDGFDSSCAAMAQGPSRLDRGRAFATYVNERLGAHHVVKVVPGCGHDAACMFTADSALPVLFPQR